MNRQDRMLLELPKPEDAIPARMCLRCGFRGPHPRPIDCIAELRDIVATLEFRIAAMTKNGGIRLSR